MTRALKLTQTIEAIADLTEQRGIPPTIREVQQRLGISSTSVAHSRIKELRDKGLVTMEPGIARSLRVVGEVKPV